MPPPSTDPAGTTRGVGLRPAPSGSGAAARPAAVLVVDDEQDILDSLGLVLQIRLEGVEVLTALSGAQALERMRDRPVGAILTDYKMPGMDGFEFIAEARKLDAAVPVIMMTAYPDPSLAERARRDHGVGLLVAKPFDMKRMVDLVSRALDGRPLVAGRADVK